MKYHKDGEGGGRNIALVVAWLKRHSSTTLHKMKEYNKSMF